MKWTKTKPKVEGWYWVKAVGALSGNVYETMVKVYNSKPVKKDEPNRVFWDGSNYSINDNDSFVEWGSEPIPEIK